MRPACSARAASAARRRGGRGRDELAPFSAWSAACQLKRYLEGRLRHARAHSGEGLIAELVRVEAEGGRISADDFVGDHVGGEPAGIYYHSRGMHARTCCSARVHGCHLNKEPHGRCGGERCA